MTSEGASENAMKCSNKSVDLMEKMMEVIEMPSWERPHDVSYEKKNIIEYILGTRVWQLLSYEEVDQV